MIPSPYRKEIGKTVMNDNRNLLILVLVSVSILVGWHFFYEMPQAGEIQKERRAAVMEEEDALPTGAHHEDIGRPSEIDGPLEQGTSLEEALTKNARTPIQTPKVKGSIDLVGAKLDDLTLLKYREGVDPDTPNISLLQPNGADMPYYAEFGWLGADKSLNLPKSDTVWKSRNEVTSGHTLIWENGDGLDFEQSYALDENYMFTVRSQVTNNTDRPVVLYPYARIVRKKTPETSGFFILHEGPIGYIDNKLEEYKYEDLQKKQDIRLKGQGGWTGMTDKYWLTALVPDQKNDYEFFFRDRPSGATDVYQSGYYGKAITIQPNEAFGVTHNFFAGAKELDLLDAYEETLGVKHFDLAVDFGWFYFITKPMFYTLTFLHDWIGNFGLAILLLTVILKIFFLPLANKSYRSMAKMKTVQPKIKAMQERYKDDKVRQNQELMALYKKEKINPAAGCLPIIIQIPVFFALYKVLFVSIEMRQAPFYGWIHDLSAPDPTTVFNLFGLIPWTPPSFLMIGAWPLIMGATMLLQQKLNPAPQDPIQEKMLMIMPVLFTVMLANFPAGLVIYWAWNNILSILQQWYIMKIANKSHGKQKK